MSENCEDYDGYHKTKNKEFTVKCGDTIWASEEEMRKGIECYDQAHSKAKCLTGEQIKRMEKEVQRYIDEGSKPICADAKDSVFQCVKQAGNIASCFQELEYFKECLAEVVRETFQEQCHDDDDD